MRLNKKTIQWFEKEQKDYGTKVALYNLIFTIAGDLMREAGANHFHACDNENCECETEE